MTKVVVDIETVGFDFDSFDKTSQDYLLKFGQTEEEKTEIKKKMGLYPLTGEVVAIGMLNPDTLKGSVLFQDKSEELKKFEENGIAYETGSESQILSRFWEVIKAYDQVITFNGRGFDIPFLMMRSAVNGIRPSRNLMGYRYEHEKHCDLLDQLTFYGAMRKFNLDFCVKAFKIKSSKEGGIDGSMVGELFKKGKFVEIARYCARDITATKELFDYWEKYLKF